MEAYWLVHELRWEEGGPLHTFVRANKGPILFCEETMEASNARQRSRMLRIARGLEEQILSHGGEWIFFVKFAHLLFWLHRHPLTKVATSVAHLPKHKIDQIEFRLALAADCEWEEVERQLLLPVDRVKTKADTFYHVFTPFYRRVRSALDAPRKACFRGRFEGESEWNHFLESGIHAYLERRDFLAQAGTSGISKSLRFGEISSCRLMEDALSQPISDGVEGWIRQLIWREFYYRIYFEKPEALTTNWNGKLVEWESASDGIERWKAGETGYPLVDAAMRQLVQTGEMHNRARMIAASFLVKDLHVDWRVGEKFFMEQLIDADPFLNNGGWQWVASTGCDAQPYFRIFNPWTQSKRFDPDATWIKKWLPELRNIATREIHRASGDRGHGYSKPICEHAREARIAKLYFANKN